MAQPIQLIDSTDSKIGKGWLKGQGFKGRCAAIPRFLRRLQQERNKSMESVPVTSGSGYTSERHSHRY